MTGNYYPFIKKVSIFSLITFMLSIIVSSSLLTSVLADTAAQSNQTSAPSSRQKASSFGVDGLSVEFLANLGYRNDDLKWNIAGDTSGNNPNVLSELTWDDLNIFQVGLKNKTVFRGAYFKGYIQYGWIISGDNQDSDYAGDNRTLEFSRSNNSTDDDNTLDASAGIGYQFNLGTGLIGFAPLFGYSYHEQNLRITDGFQTIPATGSFEGLDSTYETEWKGPWVGVDLIIRSPEKTTLLDDFELGLEFEYHWADYTGVGNWNLRDDLAHPKSFEHDADGQGIVLSAYWNIFFKENWALNLSGNYQTWNTDAGLDRVFTAGGEILETRLNEVEWDSFAIMLGLIYRF